MSADKRQLLFSCLSVDVKGRGGPVQTGQQGSPFSSGSAIFDTKLARYIPYLPLRPLKM